MRVDGVRGGREAALVKPHRLGGAVGLQRGLAEQRIERGVALAGGLEGREQVVGLLVATVANELPGAREIGIRGKRRLSDEQGRHQPERGQTPGAAPVPTVRSFGGGVQATVSSSRSPASDRRHPAGTTLWRLSTSNSRKPPGTGGSCHRPLRALGRKRSPLGWRQKSTGSRMIGQVMQWPPPRPRPSSAPTMVMTSMPALRSSVLV